MHNTLDCRCYDSNGKPLKATADTPSESKKPYKKFGGNKNMTFMQSMFKAYAKCQKKAGKSNKCKNVTMTLATVPIVNRKLGTVTRS
jgi:hypothetical protein